MKKEDPTYNPEEEDDALLQDDTYSDEEPAEAEPADEEPAGISLKEYIKEESREDERPQGTRLSLRKILGGDNRFSCQKDEVEIARLTKLLKNSQYKALAISSELTEHCRESHVLDMLKENNDSLLHTADQPPYIIIVNGNE